MEREAGGIGKRQTVFLIAFMTVALVIYGMLFILYNRENTNVQVESLSSFTVGDPSELRFAVDFAGENGAGLFQVRGWAVKPGEVYSLYNYGMDRTLERTYNHLRVGYTDGEKVYLLPTKLERREDVNGLLQDGIDYGYCGFTGSIPAEKVREIAGGALVLIRKNPDGTRVLYYL